MKKRWISLILAVLMAVSQLPAVALADAQTQGITRTTQIPTTVGQTLTGYLGACQESAEGKPVYLLKTYRNGTTKRFPTVTDTESAAQLTVECNSYDAALQKYIYRLIFTVDSTRYAINLSNGEAGNNKFTDGKETANTQKLVNTGFLWDEENGVFYQDETFGGEKEKYVIGITDSLSEFTAHKWSDVSSGGIYPAGVYVSLCTCPWQHDENSHWKSCTCGAGDTAAEAHSFGQWIEETPATQTTVGSKYRQCECGYRQTGQIPLLLAEGTYLLTAQLDGITQYFRQTGSGEKVTYTSPYSLHATDDLALADVVSVVAVEGVENAYTLDYVRSDTGGTVRIYVYDVGTDGVVDTGVNSTSSAAYHYFCWDGANELLYQMEGDVKYVLAFQMLYNTNLKEEQLRIAAVPINALSDSVVAVKLEPYHEHSYSDWVVTGEATLTAAGERQKTCACGDVIREELPCLAGNVESWGLTLGSDLSVNFMISVHPDIVATAQVEISAGDEVFRYAVADSRYNPNTLCYDFSASVAAAQMNETIAVRIVNGDEASVEKTYTVEQYARYILADDSLSQYHRLIKQMLCYGAAAQVYFDYHADKLVNEGITDADTADIPADAAQGLKITGSVDGVRFYGASLLFRDKIGIRYYFQVSGDPDGYTFRVDGQEYSPTEKGGHYYIELDSLNPQSLSSAVTVTVDDALSVSYCPMNYIVRMGAGGSDSLKALMKALYHYHIAAVQFLKQNPDGGSISAGIVYDINQNVHFFGRTYEADSVRYFNWSASGFSVRFRGSGVQAEIVSNAPNTRNLAYLKVYVDGVEMEDVVLSETSQTITLAEGLDPNREHTVQVVKRTNARSSTAGVSQIRLLDGRILPPEENKQTLIEFMGDSLTVGYVAAEGGETAAAWSTATEDVTRTYCKQVADAFDSDYQVVAISGRGVVRNNGGDTDILYPEVYWDLDLYNNPGVAYDFARQPDVIVINLGTNDESTANAQLDTGVFQEGLYQFLKAVRQKNPNAQIIYAYGMVRVRLSDAIAQVVGQLQSEGDDRICYLQLEKCQSSELNLNHTIASAYISRGEALIEKIQELTGWETVDED